MLTQAQFGQIFPFHFTLDAESNVISAGPSLVRVCPDLRPGAALAALFEFQYPEPPAVPDLAWVLSRSQALMVLRHRSTSLPLRGQFIESAATLGCTFLGSPWLTSPDQLQEFGLLVEHFAVHDPLLDLLQLAQSQKVALEDTKRLAEKLARQRADLRAANEQLAAKNNTLIETERQLRGQSAEARKLALVAARTTNGVVISDAEGRVEWLNEGFTRITGYTLQELKGRKPGDVLQGPQTDPAAVAYMGERLNQGQGFEYQVINYHKCGRPYFVQIEVQPIVDELGRVTNFMAVESDVSAQVCDHVRLTLRDRIAHILSGENSLQSGQVRALKETALALGCTLGIAWKVDGVGEGGPHLAQDYAWHEDSAIMADFLAESQRRTFACGEGLPGRVWQLKGVVQIDDLSKDQNFPRAAMAARAGLAVALAFPVLLDGEVIGVMEFFSPRPFFPDPKMPDFLLALGAQIGLFVDRSRAQESLRIERDFANQVMALMGQGIAVTGVDRKIEYCNEAFASLVAQDQQKLIGCNPFDLLGSGEIGQFSRRWWWRATQERMVFESRLRRPDGSSTLVLITSVPRRRNGRPRGHIATITDLSEREKFERTLMEAKVAAENANQAKGYFLATMSHEIRTPMNAVIGMAGLLRRTELSSRQIEFVEAVQASAEALLEIIDDILDFSKIESNNLRLEIRDVEIRVLVEGLLEALAPRAHAKKLELTAIVDPSVPDTIRADPTRLRQVVLNLVSNAIKFTAQGEVVLRLQSMQSAAGRPCLRFAVKDTGVGISAEQQKQIFRPFVQADATTTRRFGGTGLGLAISKRLVEIFGGEVGLESSEGRGSIFWFTHPLERAQPSGKAVERSEVRGTRVLLVDASEAVRESLTNIAQTLGLRFESCAQQAVANRLITEAIGAGDPFRVVMFDLGAEGGAAFAARIGTEFGPDRPRRLALLHTNDAAAQPSGHSASYQHILKPVKAGSLYSALVEALGRKPVLGTAGSAGSIAPFSRPGNVDIRILVADDNDTNRRFAYLMLESLGYKADFAVNGGEAVEAVRRHPYDVILMDCQMPLVDGYAATREIRAIEAAKGAQGRPIRIIAMTADAMADNRAKCLAAGMDDFITKPVRIEIVRDALRAVTRAPAASAGTGVVRGETSGGLDPEALECIALLRRDFGDVATADLILSFLDDGARVVTDLRHHFDSGDLSKVGKAAHSLAGGCGIFGFHALKEQARFIEETCRGTTSVDLSNSVSNVEVDFTSAQRTLRKVLTELDTGSASAS